MAIELTIEVIKQALELYDEIGNIKKVAKIMHISYGRLRNVIKSNTITPKEYDTKSYRKEVKRKSVEYKGGKCLICGYNKCNEALEFHHLNPTEKDFTISGGTKSFESLKPELDKCILLCSNCHKELHAGITKI